MDNPVIQMYRKE